MFYIPVKDSICQFLCKPGVLETLDFKLDKDADIICDFSDGSLFLNHLLLTVSILKWECPL